jgi:membrane protease YdiL (CAAX protease family)
MPYESVEKSPELVEQLGVLLATRLRRSSEDEAEAADQRVVMGELLVKVIVLLCSYALLLSALPALDLDITNTTTISLPIIAVFGIGSWRFLRKTGRPLSEFGLGVKNFFPALIESAVLTLPFCSLLAGLKWIALRIHQPWNDLPLFEHTDWKHRLAEPYVVKLLVVYFASSAVQEMIVRSALQSSLEGFLVGPRRREVTLFVCALMFAINHLHMSFVFASLAFVPGIFWGWLFWRRRNLIGPVLSHFVVGAFVFFVLGVSLP